MQEKSKEILEKVQKWLYDIYKDEGYTLLADIMLTDLLEWGQNLKFFWIWLKMTNDVIKILFKILLQIFV